MSNMWQTIVGHQWAVQLLAGAIEHDRIGHAYLITGPEQVGKTTLARTFAQALNCQSPDERPCGHCRACQLISLDRHSDVRLVRPEISGRGKAAIKIDTIRELQRELNLSTYEVRYKIAIIRDFDAATVNAANAFLKTLEEPPENVILLLTAKDGDSLLPTITSRCRTVALRAVPKSLIDVSLQQQWHVSPETARLLAHVADGRVGWAVQASQEPALLAARQEHIEHLYEALVGTRVARFDLVDRLVRKPERVPDTLRTWLSWWRDLVLLSHQDVARKNGDAVVTNIDQRGYLERMARTWSKTEVETSLRHTRSALWQLDRNANIRLVLENLLLIYPYQTG